MLLIYVKILSGCDMPNKTKPWRFTEKRKQSLKKAQKRHVELVDAGKRAMGYQSSTKRVRVARKVRSSN